MKGIMELPQGYQPLMKVDLAGNKRLFVLVNAGALVIGAGMTLLGLLFTPLSALFDKGFGLQLLLRSTALLVGMVAYIVLHELVHGVFIRLFSGKRAKYGFGLSYAWAGSDAYFEKIPYLVIALAPVVFWGAVLAVLCAVVPPGWFWVVYFIQVLNISGAVGDFYVTVRFLTLPRDILVQDSGTAMTVFAKTQETQ